jgi:predicted DNA-binding antitoxin AbrB/MazE fold protein
MKPKNKIAIPAGERIKVQLDNKTIVFVRSQSALDMWMEKYPEAKIVG